MRAIRAARFGAAVEAIQRHARERGLDKMTMEEIDAEIATARKERLERAEDGR